MKVGDQVLLGSEEVIIVEQSHIDQQVKIEYFNGNTEWVLPSQLRYHPTDRKRIYKQRIIKAVSILVDNGITFRLDIVNSTAIITVTEPFVARTKQLFPATAQIKQISNTKNRIAFIRLPAITI